jgi:aspartate/methionine/tyrosine aminotransferase
VFTEKRDVTVAALLEMGIRCPREPEGTFYAFGSIAELPPPLNDGVAFYREALKHRVLTVPGEYFDVNPDKQRAGPSPLAGYVRFSFGPPMENLRNGLARLKQMIQPG